MMKMNGKAGGCGTPRVFQSDVRETSVKAAAKMRNGMLMAFPLSGKRASKCL